MICMCGCGAPVAARFVVGHNGKLMHRLYEADRRGLPVLIYGTQYRPDFYAARVSPYFAGYFQELVREARR